MKLSEIARKVIELATEIVKVEIAACEGRPLFCRADQLPPRPPNPARAELRAFLLSQPVAVIYTLMLIMYTGRGDIEPSELMKEYQEKHAVFGKPSGCVDHMLGKNPLAHYLEEGLRLLAESGSDVDRLLEA